MCEDTKVNAKQCSKDHLFPYLFGPIFVTNALMGEGKSESVHFVFRSDASLMIFRCSVLGNIRKKNFIVLLFLKPTKPYCSPFRC